MNKRSKILDIAVLLSLVLLFASLRISFSLGWKVYLVHFVVFAPFGIYLNLRGYSLLASFLIALFLSSTGEICQKLFFNRVGEFLDVSVDSLSVAIGWFLARSSRLVSLRKK